MAQSKEERERNQIDQVVHQVIALHDEVSLLELTKELDLDKETVQSAIDRLRKRGVPIEIVPHEGGLLHYRLTKEI